MMPVLLIGSCTQQQQEEEKGFSVISFNQLTEIIDKPTDKMKVINFWATWCKPCIAEMPYFESVAKSQSDNVELIFVSLDFPEDVEKVKTFIKKKNISAEVYLLNDTNYDEFLPKIDKSWSGAIPATLFVNKQENKYFYEKSFTEEELNTVVNSLL